MNQTPWNRIVKTTAAVSEPVSLGRVKRSLGLDNVIDYDTTLQELIASASAIVFTIPKADTLRGGGMAERTIATVLKTVEPHGSGGSNPPPSARHRLLDR